MMRTVRFTTLLLLATATMLTAGSVHDFTLNSIDGEPVSLADYDSKVLLMVNVASRCGFTPQYKSLEALHRKYKDDGLVVMGFPANNFGAQEPGTDKEIKAFCSRKFDVSFPMFSKISVKGADIAPLYQHLTSNAGGEVRWNFTKFLVDSQGKVIGRFESDVEPESSQLTSAVEKALAK